MIIAPKSIDEQKFIFSNYWDEFSAQIKSGDSFVDFPGEKDSRLRYFTSIIRLPSEIARKLYNSVNSICPNDYHYPVSDIHTTVVGIQRVDAGDDDINWSIFNDDIAERIKDLEQLELNVCGLGIFPTTIYAQIYIKPGVIDLYRQAVLDAYKTFKAIDPDKSIAKIISPGVAFANLVRFKNQPDNTLLNDISKLRNANFGTFSPEFIEVVKTNKLFQSQHTQTMQSVKIQ